MPNIEEYQAYFASRDCFETYTGLELREVDEGHAVVELHLQAQHRNVQGIVHGGVTFSLCDMAASVAASNFAEERRAVRTLQASMYYLRPGKGNFLRAVGKRVKSGRTTGLAEAEVFDEEGRMIAKGEFSVFYI
jgi:acyl-CoA thioesterase